MRSHDIIFENDPMKSLVSISASTSKRKGERYAEHKTTTVKMKTEYKNAIMEEEFNSDKFFHIILHEIRNPLTSIHLAGYLLKTKRHNTRTNEMISDLICRNAEKIEHLLRNLLHSDGIHESPLKQTDICAVIDKSLAGAEDRIFLKKIKVIKRYDENVFALADGNFLSIAFLNMILNAVEAMKERGTLHVEIYKTKEEIKIIMKDDGAGMDEETASRIFDREYTRNPDGLGLGMYIVKHILDQHKAVIDVQSRKGAGTTCVVSMKTRGN
jgi:signal transduction histidine kinase